MKLLLVAIVVAGFLLPTTVWGQHLLIPSVRSVAAKPKAKQIRYARLDQYAQHLPDAQATTLDKLAASLATQARTDDDKARLIFAWLAYHIAYDVTYPRGDTTQYYRCKPENVLRSCKAICQGYADLFTELAIRMKLEACTVTGHGRGQLDAGNLLSVANGHSWNAYRIAGTWHLVDATWGAGGIVVEKNEFAFQFEPFWFDTPPVQMIFTHLPDSAAWQLLPMPVIPAVFQSWPYVAPAWFQLIDAVGLVQALSSSKSPVNRLPSVEVTKATSRVRIVQVPLRRELVGGQPVKFIFQAPPEVEFSIEMDTSLVVLKPRGGYQQATITPTTGLINVSAWCKVDTTFVCSLQYEAVHAPRSQRPRPGEYRATPADSVVYLRRKADL